MKQQSAPADAFGTFQQALARGWQQAMESFQSIGANGASGAPVSMPMADFGKSVEGMSALPKFSLPPERMQIGRAHV